MATEDHDFEEINYFQRKKSVGTRKALDPWEGCLPKAYQMF
jgi:hypothetical protein